MRIAIAVVLAIAITVALVWRTQYSREAKIDAAYASCMRQFGGAAPPAASATPAQSGSPTAADALGKAMQDLVRGVTAGMSGAVCGAVRDACHADFDGAVCQNALAGFR